MDPNEDQDRDDGQDDLRRAIEGDQTALTRLLKTHAPALRADVAGRIPARHRSAFDVDDVLQVTFLEAFLRIGSFKPTGPDALAAWLRRIARNNLTDAQRELDRKKRPPRQRRVTSGAAPDSCVSLLEQLGAHSHTPSQDAALLEAGRIIDDGLRTLPPDYARVVRLYELECKEVGEVACAMGRSPAAVFMLRRRALDRLKETLPTASKFFTWPGA